MTGTSSVSQSSDVLNQYRRDEDKAPPKKNELGQNEFLKLMIAELNNQNPLDPKDNGEFIAQLAQFSQVEGLERLNKSTDTMSDNMRSSQALQASSLVGQSVIVEGNDTGLMVQGGVVSSFTDLTSSVGSASLSIQDENGVLLEQIPLGSQPQGEMSVRWDGLNLQVNGKIVDVDISKLNRQEYYKNEEGEFVLDNEGNKVPVPYPPGEYKFKITGEVSGKTEEFQTEMSSRVDSVSIGNGGAVTVNLSGGQRASLDQVKQVAGG